jgi:hypothetical protein
MRAQEGTYGDLLLEMFDCLSTELSRLLEARERRGGSADSETALMDAKIAHLGTTLDRLEAAIGPEHVHLH